MLFAKITGVLLYFVLSGVTAFDYLIIQDIGEIKLTDVNTQISNLKTAFVGAETAVKVEKLEWKQSKGTNTAKDLLFWATSVDGQVQAKGTFNLSSLSRELPESLEVGTIRIDDRADTKFPSHCRWTKARHQ